MRTNQQTVVFCSFLSLLQNLVYMLNYFKVYIELYVFGILIFWVVQKYRSLNE